MEINDLIDIHFFGLKRDSGSRGHVWGYFTPKGICPEGTAPVLRYSGYYRNDPPPTRICIFWGKVGKSFHIKEVDYDNTFVSELTSKKNNFRTYDPARILPNWKEFREEMELYVLMRRLKGENNGN